MEGRVKVDIWYMEHWTMLLDLYIIYKTIANIIVGEKNMLIYLYRHIMNALHISTKK